MADRKVAPFDEFHHQSKSTHVFQKHPVDSKIKEQKHYPNFR
jgi:hypothetical protein